MKIYRVTLKHLAGVLTMDMCPRMITTVNNDEVPILRFTRPSGYEDFDLVVKFKNQDQVFTPVNMTSGNQLAMKQRWLQQPVLYMQIEFRDMEFREQSNTLVILGRPAIDAKDAVLTPDEIEELAIFHVTLEDSVLSFLNYKGDVVDQVTLPSGEGGITLEQVHTVVAAALEPYSTTEEAVERLNEVLSLYALKTELTDLATKEEVAGKASSASVAALTNQLDILQRAFTSRTPVSGRWEPTWLGSDLTYGSVGESFWVRTGRRVDLFFHLEVASADNAIPTVGRIGPLPFAPSEDALWYPATISFADGFGPDTQGKTWAVHLRNNEDSFRAYVTDNVSATQLYVRQNGIWENSDLIGTATYYTDDPLPEVE